MTEDDELVERLRAALPRPLRRDPVLDLPKAGLVVLTYDEYVAYGFVNMIQEQCRAKARRVVLNYGGMHGIPSAIPEIVFCGRPKGHAGPHCTSPGEAPRQRPLPAAVRLWQRLFGLDPIERGTAYRWEKAG